MKNEIDLNLINKIASSTKIAERVKLCDEIDKTYNLFFEATINNKEKLNSSGCFKFIIEYLMVALGYAKEISILQKSGWNNSIECLTRNFLECYAYAKKLLSLHGTADYSDYLKNLFVLDLAQTRREFDCMYEDISIVDIERRDNDAASYIERWENIITENFSERISTVSESNKVNDLKKIIKELKKEYDLKYPENEGKHKLVATAIKDNKLIKDYNGGELLYKALSSSVHNNLYSVENRVLVDGYFSLNNNTVNLYPCVEIVFYCLKDCLNEYLKILA